MRMSVVEKRDYIERNLEYFSSKNMEVPVIFIDTNTLHEKIDVGGDESVDYVVAGSLLYLAAHNHLDIEAVNEFHKANVKMRKKLTKILKSVKG